MKLVGVVFLALCATLCLSFSHSSLLFWTNREETLPNALSVSANEAGSLISFVLNSHQILVVYEYEHSFEELAQLEKIFGNAPSSSYIPYVTIPSEKSIMDHVHNPIVVDISSLDELKDITFGDSKVVVHVQLPSQTSDADDLIKEISDYLQTIGDYASVFRPIVQKSGVIHKFHARYDPIPYDGTKGLLELYSFFGPGIFMGIVSGIVFIFIMVTGLLCLNSLQTPTKFESNK